MEDAETEGAEETELKSRRQDGYLRTRGEKRWNHLEVMEQERQIFWLKEQLERGKRRGMQERILRI